MEVACVIQARMGSSRLPGKVLADLAGSPMLVFMLDRLQGLDGCHLVVATSDTPRDDPVADAASRVGAAVVRGPEHDVLERFGVALEESPADIVVRLTADCPLVDPEIVTATIDLLRTSGADYASNTLVRTFPHGLDVEVMRRQALSTAIAEASDAAEREHVTPFIYRRPERFRLAALRNDKPFGDEWWTVDTPDDLEFVRGAVTLLGGRRDFSWQKALEVIGRRAEPAPGKLSLRPALPGDAELLIALRNDPDAVASSGSGQAVSLAEHQQWFRRCLQNPASRIWIGQIDGAAVGQTRVDVEAAIGTVSVAVEAAHRGEGHATAMLVLLQEALRLDYQVKVLVAHVHQGNRASKAAFQRAGFALKDPAPGSEFQTFRWDRSGSE